MHTIIGLGTLVIIATIMGRSVLAPRHLPFIAVPSLGVAVEFRHAMGILTVVFEKDG